MCGDGVLMAEQPEEIGLPAPEPVSPQAPLLPPESLLATSPQNRTNLPTFQATLAWLRRNWAAIKLSLWIPSLLAALYLIGWIGWLAADGQFVARDTPNITFAVTAIDDASPPAPQDSWRYEQPLILNGVRMPPRDPNSDAPYFPGMIVFQALSGDVGVVGKRALAMLWYALVGPPALFLSFIMTPTAPLQKPRRTSRPINATGRTGQLKVSRPFLSRESLKAWISGRKRLAAEPAPAFGHARMTRIDIRYALKPLGRFIYFLLPLLFVTYCPRFITLTVDRSVFWLSFAIMSIVVTAHFIVANKNQPRLHQAAIARLCIALFIGIPFAVTSSVLILDTHRQIRILDQHPPRLFAPLGESERELIEKDKIAQLLNQGTLPTDEEVTDVRRRMNNLTPNIRHNLVSLNLCRATWYIVWAIVAIVTTLFPWFPGPHSELNEMSVAHAEGKERATFVTTWRRSAKPRLLLPFVLISYVAIGVVFGIIYYDYYILDAARYHLLLETFFSSAPQNERAARNAATLTEDHDATGNVRTQEGGNPKLLAILSSSYFASSVFAQDTPLIGVENNAPETVSRPSFNVTFQFRPYESVVRIHSPLYFGYNAETWRAAQEAPSACTGSLVSRGITDTNASSLALLKAFVCSEIAAPSEPVKHGYNVRVVGSADCTGNEKDNDRYGAYRAAAAAYAAREAVASLQSQTGGGDTVNAILHAIDEGRVDALAEHRPGASEPCRGIPYDVLWPHSTSPQKVNPKAWNPARAAVLTIERRTIDIKGRVKMESGLSRRTTLSDMIYFSFVTFTTTGYGDMKAVSGPVRFCVIVENILELLFTAIFFAATMAVVTRE
jgi:hypothetical protein